METMLFFIRDVFFKLFLTFVIASLIPCYISIELSSLETNIKENVVWITEFFIALVTFICLVTLLTMHHRSLGYIDVNTLNVNVCPSNRLRLLTLWCFGLFLVFMDSIYLTIYVECFDSKPFYLNVWHGVYRAMKIFLYLIQIGLLSFMNGKRYTQSKTVICSLMMLIVVNSSYCIKDTVMDLLHIAESRGSLAINRTSENISFSVDVCFENSTIQAVVDTLGPYKDPVYLEYLLLLAWQLKKILPRDELKCFSQRRVEYSINQMCETIHHGLPSRNQSRQHFSAFSILLPVIFHVPIAVSLVLLCTVDLDNETTQFFMIILECSIATVEIIKLILVIFGFHLLDNIFAPKFFWKEISGTEYILLAGFAAIEAYSCLVIVSAFHDNKAWTPYVLVKNVVLVISNYYQTSFLLYAKRREVIVQFKNSVAGQMTFIANFVGLSDLVMWILDWLLGFNRRLNSTQTDESQAVLIGMVQWHFLASCILPLFLFYKFQSGMKFYDLSCRFKKQ